MQVATKTYLKFVPFARMEAWSYAYLVEGVSRYKKDFQTIRIGDFLKSGKQSISIEDEIFYDRVTVKINTNGVVKRDTEKGTNIGTKKQYKAKAGQFIVSKIDARNGAFGIIPDELDGAIVTNDFPLFNIDTDIINPQFFFLFTGTKEFVNFAKSCSSGTTNRQRMDIDLFLKQEIPIPSLSEQEILVKNYFNKIEEAEKLSKQANDLENEIEQYLFKELGIEKETNAKEHSTFRIVQYRDIDRWDGKKDYEFNSKFDVEKIGKYITSMSTGTTPPTSRKEYFDGGNINFYAPSDLGLSMYLSKAERKVTELAIEDKKARVFKKGTLLFVGIGSTVGKIGIVANKFATSNQQITGFTVNQEFLLNEYTYYFFNSFKEITTKEQTKATLPIVNQDKIQNIPIPIPPISKQHEIVKHIQELKEKIIEQKTQAEQLKHRAEQEFEQAIFS